MIIGLWHPGSGAGDQLFCYLAARITAERLGVAFAMLGDFKGSSFIRFETGPEIIPISYRIEQPAGKIIVDSKITERWPVYEGKSHFDPEFFFIEDNTIVDGCRLQDEKYWEGYPIDEWLNTEPVYVDPKLCVIGFRGGEYYSVPELGLPKDYFVEAMAFIRSIEPDVRFRVVTDDPEMARACFPHLEVAHDIGMDWRQIRYAKYAIIANSAFYILPRLLKHSEQNHFADDFLTIAPRRWARRNLGAEWSTSQNYYPSFKYI